MSRKVLLVASAGGHWVQLCRLSEAFQGHEFQFVTTMDGYTAPVGDRPVLTVADSSQSTPHKLPVTALQLLWIILRFRPHSIITTGAAPGLIALLIGKLLGRRTMWLDSMANNEELSWSGKMAGRWADVWLTQWPELVEKHSGLQYRGAVM